MSQKRVNPKRAENQFIDTVQKLLDRKWLFEREKVKLAIHDGKRSEEDILSLARTFDNLGKNRPKAEIIK